MLCSTDEQDERYIELKGSDISHAIKQLRSTIIQLGGSPNNRHSYIICTKVAPMITTTIQKAKIEFKKKYNSDLTVQEGVLDVYL